MTGTQNKRDYGEVCIVKNDNEFLLNQRVGKVENHSKDITLDYLALIMSSPIYQDEIFKLTSSGARQANVSNEQLESINIFIPPISVQKDIVNQINEDKLTLNSNEALRKRLQIIYHDLIANYWESKS
jgi:restriction endonuclease S subunit